MEGLVLELDFDTLLAQFAGAQENLTGALSRLLVVVERYPDLKSNQNFLELQSQLGRAYLRGEPTYGRGLSAIMLED